MLLLAELLLLLVYRLGVAVVVVLQVEVVVEGKWVVLLEEGFVGSFVGPDFFCCPTRSLAKTGLG